MIDFIRMAERNESMASMSKTVWKLNLLISCIFGVALLHQMWHYEYFSAGIALVAVIAYGNLCKIHRDLERGYRDLADTYRRAGIFSEYNESEQAKS